MYRLYTEGISKRIFHWSRSPPPYKRRHVAPVADHASPHFALATGLISVQRKLLGMDNDSFFWLKNVIVVIHLLNVFGL